MNSGIFLGFTEWQHLVFRKPERPEQNTKGFIDQKGGLMSTTALSAKKNALQNLMAKKNRPETKGKNTGLGTNDFMKLLVAQLKNQSPLKPADTKTFTNQLAQFTQVESLGNIDKKMGALLDQAKSSGQGRNITDYVGMQVTGEVTTMTIDKGNVSSGFYDLPKSARVKIVIRDDKGKVVKTLNQGEQKKGAYLINWDGTSDNGKPLPQGAYTYTVLANTGTGYQKLPANITGKVDAVAYQNGKAYLVVGRVLVDPASLTSATKPTDTPKDNAPSILDYLGRTVTSNFPIVQVKEGKVLGGKLGFHLDKPQDVTIKIYDAANKLVKTIKVPAKDTVAGNNKAHWDALADSGHRASDGLFYYKVETKDGPVKTPVSGKVTGIKYINGGQFLELGESGRLVSVSKISSVK